MWKADRTQQTKFVAARVNRLQVICFLVVNIWACVSNRKPEREAVDAHDNTAFDRDSNNEERACDLDHQRSQQQHQHPGSDGEQRVYSVMDNKTTVEGCNNNEMLKDVEFDVYLWNYQQNW